MFISLAALVANCRATMEAQDEENGNATYGCALSTATCPLRSAKCGQTRPSVIPSHLLAAGMWDSHFSLAATAIASTQESNYSAQS
jgi:hypothetical protein